MADPQKPGIKSSEFWLSVIAMLMSLALFIAESLSSGESLIVKSIAMAVAGLSALGYSFGRSKVKAANSLAAGAMASVLESAKKATEPPPK